MNWCSGHFSNAIASKAFIDDGIVIAADVVVDHHAVVINRRRMRSGNIIVRG